MNYIVLDLEWNQPIYKKSTIKNPVLLKGEIIQIGAVKLNSKFNVIDTFTIMVAPKYYTIMKKNVSKITKIRTRDLQLGFPFEKALDYFKRWSGEDFIFLTWGYDDIPMLLDNMKIHDIASEWIPKSYNIQPIFDKQITRANRQCSLSYAMEKLGEEPFDAHDALNDARSTARICMHLNMYEGFSDYVGFKKKAKSPEKNMDNKVYSSRVEAKSAPEINSFVCPRCGETVVCNKWLSYKTDRNIALVKCSCGEEYFVRIRFHKTKSNNFSVNRKIQPSDDVFRRYYEERVNYTIEKNKGKKQRSLIRKRGL